MTDILVIVEAVVLCKRKSELNILNICLKMYSVLYLSIRVHVRTIQNGVYFLKVCK